MTITTLCVLAGGESRRFGSPKTDVYIGDVPVCAWLAERLSPLGSNIVLSVANDSPAVRGEDAFDQIIADRQSHAGPLAGMQTVVDELHASRNRNQNESLGTCEDGFVIFVTADMPLMSAGRIDQLLATLHENTQLAGVMNRWGSDGEPKPSEQRRSIDIEPFPSVWRLDLAHSSFSHAIKEGIRGPHRLAARSDVATLPISSVEKVAFTNVNTPDDLAKLARDHPELHLSVQDQTR